jgi:hypothetical protein
MADELEEYQQSHIMEGGMYFAEHEPMTFEEDAVNDMRLQSDYARRMQYADREEEREAGHASPYWGKDDEDDGEDD